MALALSQAASVKAEIRLHQALKQFSLALEPRHQAEFNIFKSQSAPTFETVIELSIQVSRDGRYQHAGGWLPKFGPRLEPLLHRIQLFSTAGDLLIGGSQNLIASGVWACVRLFLKAAIGYLSFFDKFSLVWDRVGQSALIHVNLARMFPQSP
ncbi:hypothetical protein BGZ61DRAFT_436880 [Ilyonectria robusta]|uniref:uncharacterized protein n=1 Tax=Ilyonectria robusta TaxID=1079257 RepID=UPI001E8E8B2D|nr:uncharacterized protein BGZ61DRAFT_436880 [Ilyonectria robusta]KAH8736715.1 hypothetical protein BGZ61DRAFT_436880 [Ilyonectria robusta]